MSRYGIDQFHADLNNAEIKMLEKMNASASLASISSIFSTFSAAQNNVIQARQQQLGKVIEYIQTPGKKFISDQTAIKVSLFIISLLSSSWVFLSHSDMQWLTQCIE